MPADDALHELIEQITVDAYGDEGYWSFLQAIEDEISFPYAASLVGVEVVVTGIDFDGDEPRGLVATVAGDGRSATISILDLDLTAAAPPIGRIVAATDAGSASHSADPPTADVRRPRSPGRAAVGSSRRGGLGRARSRRSSAQ